MLEGTDLYSAYQPLSDYEYVKMTQPESKEPVPQPVIQPQKQEVRQPPPQPSLAYDANAFNQRYEQEQKVLYSMAANQAPRKKEEVQQQSYIDKLFSRKRELMKLLQFVFVIVLALSLHSLIEYYLKEYINDNEMSPWRQFFLRILYPVAALFILWNLKVFVK